MLINGNNEYRLQLKNGDNDTDHKIYTQIMESLESANDLPLEINQFNPESIQLSKKQIYLTYKHISEKIDQQLAKVSGLKAILSFAYMLLIAYLS